MRVYRSDITIGGKHTASRKVSAEFIASWVVASRAVLSLHNYVTSLPITVEFYDKDNDGLLPEQLHSFNIKHWPGDSIVYIKADLEALEMAKCILDGCIRVYCRDFGFQDWCITDAHYGNLIADLCVKIFPDVAAIAAYLNHTKQARAAAFAHVKIGKANGRGACEGMTRREAYYNEDCGVVVHDYRGHLHDDRAEASKMRKALKEANLLKKTGRKGGIT
jgi:hypothetical protein